MTGDRMREAMDYIRTDTDDLTGATSPVPTDDELTTAVALLASQPPPPAPRRPPPGWRVVGALAACILVADVGLILALTAQERQQDATCERINTVRATFARVLVSQEASVPAERYDADTRKFYDQALGDLAPVDCEEPDRRQVEEVERMPREVGQPSPVVVPGAGATGKTGAAGVAGLVGADGAPGRDGTDGAPGPAGSAGSDGRDGIDGADGAPGESVTGPPAPTTTLLPPATTTTTAPCLLLCP